MGTGRLNKDQIAGQLRTERVGRTLEIFDDLDSTNRRALDRLQSGSADGLVVLAEHQSAGKGRRGRAWHCPTGAGILCTVAIADEDHSLDANLLSLVVPLALCDGLHTTTDVPCEIKWPNDLVARTRKLGGVLIESRPDAGGALGYAIGFGINCLQQPRHFPSELRDRVTSLNMESNHAIDRTSVLASVLTALDGWLAQPGSWRPAEICARWKDRAWGLGARVRLQHEGNFFAGNLIDIDPTAAIIVQLDHGGRRLFSASNTRIVEQNA